MAQSTPWAILLMKWNDKADEPNSSSFYQNLFTTAGTGTFNMTDYFDTMSHGSLDVSGSQVFGWMTLDQPQSVYVGNAAAGPGQLDRGGLLAAAKAKATASGVDLTQFWGVVVAMNTLTDLCGWVGGRAALCDPGSFEPTVLGQEMGHGYGMLHSRVDGSTDDYQDPWDTMSTWDGCYYASSPDYTLIGPGLCAANMRYMAWLDESRVWKSSSAAFSQQVILRPLHARSLPGHLAAEVPGTPGNFLVEFRVPEDWDVAFPRAAVFVHRLSDGHSYRMIGSNGSSDLVAGDRFTAGSEVWRWSSFTSVHVDEINESEHYAKVTLTYRPAERIPIPSIWGEIFGGVAVDGGGLIFINGHPVPVDPWGPLVGVLNQVAAHSFADQIADPSARLEAKKSALAQIVQIASGQLADLTELETPPAPTRQIEGKGSRRE
jgi:hypothetical protein